MNAFLFDGLHKYLYIRAGVLPVPGELRSLSEWQIGSEMPAHPPHTPPHTPLHTPPGASPTISIFSARLKSRRRAHPEYDNWKYQGLGRRLL